MTNQPTQRQHLRRPLKLSEALTDLPTRNENTTAANLTHLSIRRSAKKLPDECRVKCSGCFGSGARNCQLCHGFGYVCPGCRGMERVRTGECEHGIYTEMRCEKCLTPTLRMDNIQRYLERWNAKHPEEEIHTDGNS